MVSYIYNSDGCYPLENGKGWEKILQIDEETVTSLLGNNGKLINKEFVVIPRWEDDYDYESWKEAGREKHEYGRKKYYPGAIAVYKHDFKCWLIRKTA